LAAAVFSAAAAAASAAATAAFLLESAAAAESPLLLLLLLLLLLMLMPVAEMSVKSWGDERATTLTREVEVVRLFGDDATPLATARRGRREEEEGFDAAFDGAGTVRPLPDAEQIVTFIREFAEIEKGGSKWPAEGMEKERERTNS
jgi:hypothetical protein